MARGAETAQFTCLQISEKTNYSSDVGGYQMYSHPLNGPGNHIVLSPDLYTSTEMQDRQDLDYKIMIFQLHFTYPETCLYPNANEAALEHCVTLFVLN